jgi:hypothetical protein
MPLSGDVKTFSLSAIVRMIYEEQKTGLLTVTEVNRDCRIYFRRGKIMSVIGNRDKELRLGVLLRANNLISEEKLEDMLAVAKAMEKPLGVVLVERDYISSEDLAKILNLQFKEVVSPILSWDKARFTYRDGLDGNVQDVGCEVDPVRIIHEAKKREEFKGIIPNDQVVFRINPGAETSKSVHAPRELRILLLLDGKRSVAQIIKETGYSRLAVYRSLASLYAQNAVVRKDASRQVPKMDWSGPQMIIGLYTGLLQLMFADLAAETGHNKATSSLDNSLANSSYYEHFLKVYQPNQDLAANLSQIQAFLKQQRKTLTQKDFIKGFNQVVAGLLRAQYQLLGYKATKRTVDRMKEVLVNLPENRQLLARAIRRSLDHYEDEHFLSGKGSLATAMSAIDSGSIEARTAAASADMDKVGAKAIVHFYNDMFQAVITELGREVGSKALDLLKSAIQGARYHDTFLTQFDLQGNTGNIALRIREQISAKGFKPSEPELVGTFQEVLRGLLFEKSKLLGPRAAEATIARLGEQMAAAHPHFRPLVDQLTALAVSEKV